MATDLEVVDRRDEERFEGYLDGELVGVIEYRQTDDGIVAEHTEVGEDHEGRGLASQLVGGMIQQLSDSGRTLKPECSYVRSWLDRHPDEADAVEITSAA